MQVRQARQRADLVDAVAMAFAGTQTRDGQAAMSRFVAALRRS